MEFAIFIVIMIVVSLVAKAKQQSAKPGEPNARVQKLIERIQAQQGFNQPTQPQGQYIQPTPAQLQQPAHYQPPNQYQPQTQYQQPTQFQPPAQWLPSYGPPQGHRPPQNNLPTPRRDTDTRVRELMNTSNEVAAIRLLCDEQDMGILEAQEYARALVAPADQQPTSTQRPPAASKPASESASKPAPESESGPEPEESETRYVGSAAFAESIFDLDREEDTWASGWVDTPEPEDRSDIDELWQTVRNPPRPGTTPPS